MRLPSNNRLSQPDPTHNNYTHFQHKRLCERWLDNLFMVLYEDLRAYTIWRTQMAHGKATDPSSSVTSATSSPNPNNTAAPYNRSAEEWEILGDLAERLHHGPEAIEAYQACLRLRFSPKAMRAVTCKLEEERRTESVLQGMIRLIAWQYRWYSEVGALIASTSVHGCTCKVDIICKRLADCGVFPVFAQSFAHDSQAH